jgi:hypothetical protein
MQPFLASAVRRGPKPRSTWLDALLQYLIWLKLGLDYKRLAALLQLPVGRLTEDVKRVRPVLRETLEFEWWGGGSRMRPEPVPQSPWPQVALLIDSHSTEVFRPKTRFAEGRLYYDGHNRIYAVKSEVAVRATPPHLCLFVSPHQPGSLHDYRIHREVYPRLLPFLTKTPAEHTALPLDQAAPAWSVMGDKGYVGPATDTPGEVRVVPHRPARTEQELEFNQVLSSHRVPVEHFFGRVVRSFAVMRNVYRWDHEHFDDDFTVCCLLVNEMLSQADPPPLDPDFYDLYLGRRASMADARHRARRGLLRWARQQNRGAVPHPPVAQQGLAASSSIPVPDHPNSSL